MAISVSDRFVKRILSPGLPALLAALMLPGSVACYIAVKTIWLGVQESDLTLGLLDLYSIKGLPADVTKTLGACLPALVMAVCLRGKERESLTLSGQVSLVVLIIGGTVSLAATAYINPADANQAFKISGGADALRVLQAGADASMRYALTYLLLIVGLKTETRK